MVTKYNRESIVTLFGYHIQSFFFFFFFFEFVLELFECPSYSILLGECESTYWSRTDSYSFIHVGSARTAFKHSVLFECVFGSSVCKGFSKMLLKHPKQFRMMAFLFYQFYTDDWSNKMFS